MHSQAADGLPGVLRPRARHPRAGAVHARGRRAVPVAARIQETNLHYLSQCRGFRGNRVELVAWMAQELLANNRGGPSWGRVAALVTFAGTLLERPPPGARRRKKTENEDVSRHCQFLVALLCAQLFGRQGERGGCGDPGRVGSPGRAHAAGTWRDPAASAPWGVRFSRPGTFLVKSGFLLYWRSQTPKQA